MKTCNVCGASLSDEAMFCGSCGSSLIDSDADSNVSGESEATSGTTVLNEPLENNYQPKQVANQDDFYGTTVLKQNIGQAQQPVNQQYQQPIQQPVNQQYQQPVQQPVNQQYQQPVQQPANQQYQQQYALGYVPKRAIFDSYGLFWKNYATFDGRTRRADYWQFYLVNMLIFLAASITIFIPILYYILITIYSLAIFIPSLAIIVRRLHDIGKDWYYIFFGLIPLVGPIILIVFMCTDSDMGPNQFGRCPKLP